MGVNANDVPICFWKILKLSSEILTKFFIRFRFVSFALIFSFLLYMIFTSLFWFLVYWFPIFAFTAVVLRIFVSLRNAKEYKGDDKSDGKACGMVFDRNGKSLVHVHSVRRRRAKDIMREDDSQNNVEEKSTIFSTSLDFGFVDKRDLIEESLKDIREVEVNSSPNRPQCSSCCISKNFKPEFCDGAYEGSENFDFGVSETGLSDDSEDEEVAREAGNEAVEWTVDDQKNLMDLGISEIERNKRLESLIARRKARKLFSLQVRRTLMNKGRNDAISQISHIAVPKNSSLLQNTIGQFSPSPGSAPSVLIPKCNPFDLPYDPCEEKPDLTGDSFSKEFLAVQNRDITFCRHESFSLEASLPGGFIQDRAETSMNREFVLSQRASRETVLGSQLDWEFNRIVEPKPIQEPDPKTKVNNADDQIKELIEVREQRLDHHNEEDNAEVHTKPIPVEDSSGRASSSSSEKDEPIYEIDKDAVLKSISSPGTSNIAEDGENNKQTDDTLNYDVPLFVKTRSEERLYPANDTLYHHTCPLSIASDTKVELSEVSSPLTLDENLSSQNEEISIYDVKLDKEITSSSEDLWAPSSHLSGIDENESRSREVQEVSEKDTMEVWFLRIKKSEDKALSNTLAENVAEQNSVGAHSFLPPNTDCPNCHRTHVTVSHTNSKQELSDPCEKLKNDLTTICNVNGSRIMQDERGNKIDQSLTIDSECTEHVERQSEKENNCHHLLDIMAWESDNLISSEDSDDRLNKMREHEQLGRISTDFEDCDGHKLCQRSEVGISGTAQDYDHSQTSVVLTNVADEQIPPAPTPCTSPQSVLRQNFSVDNLSEFHQDIQTQVQQFNTIVENNTLYELRTGVSREILSENSLSLEISTTEPHNAADIVQESSPHQEKSAGEIDTHIDSDKPTSYEDQMQHSALCEDTGHGYPFNYPMGHEDCKKATSSGSFEEMKGKFQKFSADAASVMSSLLVEDNDNLGIHKKSEENGEVLYCVSSHGSMLNSEINLEEANAISGETRMHNADETTLLGVLKEKKNSKDSIACLTTGESSKHQEKSTGDIDKPSYEDLIQNLALCEDVAHENLLNYPMDQNECTKATASKSFEETKGELFQFFEDKLLLPQRY